MQLESLCAPEDFAKAMAQGDAHGCYDSQNYRKETSERLF